MLTDRFDSIWKWFQIEYWNYERLVHYWILHVSRFPVIYYLWFFEFGIKRYELSKFGHNSDSNFYFEICFEPGIDTWPCLIGRYHFGWIRSRRRWILCKSNGSDSLVPFRLIEMFWGVRWGSNGRGESEREGTHLGFRWTSPMRLQLGSERRRDSDDSPRRWSRWQRVEGRGEPNGGDDALDFFPEKERKAAGDGMATVYFGFERASSIWSKIEQNKIIRGGA
jgi:hypothetical protein